MAKTIVGVGDPKAIQKYSAMLAVDVGRESYFNKKMMGVGEKAQTPLQTLPHLENDAGDQISFDLVLQLKGKPTSGDNTLRGNEEDLKFYTDSLYIDQQRHGVNTGGKMSRKRTIHNMRDIARVRQSEYWARLFDETIFMYLSGARGVNTNFIEDTDFTGYAGNAFVAPDSLHLLYGGTATSKATVTSSDKMSLGLIDRTVARAKTMGRGSSGVPAIQPVKIDGESHYVLVMHPFQEYDLRAVSGSTWIDIQKAAAAAEGRNNPLFKGGLGMYNNVILHEHESVITYSDYGAGTNLNAARALFMGRQAGVVAFGSVGTGLRFDWNEEMEDRGNQLVVTTGTIFGIKKTAFTIDGTSRDFGVVSLDTYIADPNA
ncbi:MAG: N4-gp56 family major capsid protein [Methylophilus sp.]|jgi:N4-gp56 family major capsid protein